MPLGRLSNFQKSALDWGCCPRRKQVRHHSCLRSVTSRSSEIVNQQDRIRDEIIELATQSQPEQELQVSLNRKIKARVSQLIEAPQDNLAAEALRHGQGAWEVVHAPHIADLSRSLGTSFAPIRYVLAGNRIVSNVRYSSAFFKAGWLSASGEVEASGSNTLQITFDKFWLDFGIRNLRKDLKGMEPKSLLDKIINIFGKLGFLPQFSYFPVLYMDTQAQLAVFSFPPLNSNITIRRIDNNLNN